jgi:hypothetical protein
MDRVIIISHVLRSCISDKRYYHIINFRLLRHYILSSLLLCQNSSCCFRSSSKHLNYKSGTSNLVLGGLFFTLMARSTGWYKLMPTSLSSSSRILNFFCREVLESSKAVNLFAKIVNNPLRKNSANRIRSQV